MQNFAIGKRLRTQFLIRFGDRGDFAADVRQLISGLLVKWGCLLSKPILACLTLSSASKQLKSFRRKEC